MGKKDFRSREYFSDPNRFADLINAVCFEGRQIIRPENISEADSRGSGRTRDLARKVAFGAEFVIIGEESQETVDYSMPVRILESDLADYKKQINEVKRDTDKRLTEKDESVTKLTPGERLYRYPKETHIHPVITIIVSNAREWDGPRCLKDMLHLDALPKELYPYINDYPLHILEIPKLSEEYLKRFHTENKGVFSLIRASADGKRLRKLIEEGRKELETLSEDAYNFVNEYIRFDRFGIVPGNKGEKIDMRNGLDELAEILRQEGIEQGIKCFIEDKYEDGFPDALIKERLVKRFGLTKEEADHYLEKYCEMQV